MQEATQEDVDQAMQRLESDGGTDHATDLATLKFATEHVEPILAGRKTATIRLAEPDDLPGIDDRVHLCDESGDRFATAIVDDRGYTSVEMAARMAFDGHRTYADTEELVAELEGYYPDESIGPNTRVELVYWDEVWE